ncbi:MAG: L-carnitine dehydratase/bile acid-inducible protein [Gemmatimonadetes bacterium]|nr:L-carnitine dehydratase/bile acid-inducible protein [Gemmatimonadota bacterium]
MLKNVKILDMSRVLAGPLCTMMLGDMGADVIKVERADGGDETRGWGPPFDPDGQSAYYLSINRNKLSAALDLNSPADRSLLERLLGEADVVVENFRPGVLAKRGLDAERVRARFPRIVWCTIAGFADEPDRPGYDYVVQAESGWMSVTGEVGGAPMKHGIALADVLAGKDATIAVLGALVARSFTGEGRAVTVSLEESAEAALVNVAQNALVSGAAPKRWGNAHANLVPYQLFDAADRPMVIAVGSDGQWSACTRALGLDQLEGDAELASNAGRLANRARIVDAMSSRVRERPAAEWRVRLDAAGVPNGVVRSVLEVLESSNASAVTGMPMAVPGTLRRRPPRLGEHTVLVRQSGWGAFAAPEKSGL